MQTSYEMLPIGRAGRVVVPCEPYVGPVYSGRPEGTCLKDKCERCKGTGLLAKCPSCARFYVYHNSFTPVVCPGCDPHAWLVRPEPRPQVRKTYDPDDPLDQPDALEVSLPGAVARPEAGQ